MPAYNQTQTRPNFKSRFKEDWIKDKLTREAVKFADEFGKYLRDNFLSSSQIRNIFGEMKRLQMQLSNIKSSGEKLASEFEPLHTQFLLLKPKLAYSAGRLRTRALFDFKDIFDLAHDAVGSVSDFSNKEAVSDFRKRYQNFVDFVEAILAYHRSYGGK